jgi:hypothetical protein
MFFRSFLALAMLSVARADFFDLGVAAADINGADVNFESFRGKTTYIVNVACY